MDSAHTERARKNIYDTFKYQMESLKCKLLNPFPFTSTFALSSSHSKNVPQADYISKIKNSFPEYISLVRWKQLLKFYFLVTCYFLLSANNCNIKEMYCVAQGLERIGPKCYMTVDLGRLFEASQILFIEVQFTTSDLWSRENWMFMFDWKYSWRSTPWASREIMFIPERCIDNCLNSFFAASLDYLQAELVSHLCSFYFFN